MHITGVEESGGNRRAPGSMSIRSVLPFVDVSVRRSRSIWVKHTYWEACKVGGASSLSQLP